MKLGGEEDKVRDGADYRYPELWRLKVEPTSDIYNMETDTANNEDTFEKNVEEMDTNQSDKNDVTEVNDSVEVRFIRRR